MPKMTHYFDPSHVIDVADEKRAVYEAQGWVVKAEQEPVPEVTAVTRASIPAKKTTAKRAAKKS